MSSFSSLQLDVETALKTYLAAQSVAETGREIHAAHAIDTLPDAGNYIAINADPANWEEMQINAQSRVRFHVATTVTDPDTRSTQATAHKRVVGALRNLFSDQNFPAARDALNAQTNTVDGITLGFTGWEAEDADPDASAESQILTVITYIFIVYISAAA